MKAELATEIELPRGFRWSAVQAGIKASGRPDLALAVADSTATAAAMFTSNQVAAAPVLLGREHLANTGGYVRGVVVNSGNANCATGPAGIAAAREACAALARSLGCEPAEIFPSSTGIIGVPFPTAKLLSALPLAVQALGTTNTHAEQFAHAILTTDTHAKMARASIPDEVGRTANLFGCCKGAGMIGPQLGPPHATMLVYLFTDLAIVPTDARALLQSAAGQSFNHISIDGDTSTNDTVLLFNSGASGIAWPDAPAKFQQDFTAALHRLCHTLAHSIVDDGEGVTHVISLVITGAASDADAKTIARSIAHSPLCKTAWSSADPNWGRILAAAGYAGVPFDPDRLTLTIGDLPVFDRGMPSPVFDKPAVHARMLEREYTVAVDLGTGFGSCRFLTCDLTEEYVRINADYST